MKILKKVELEFLVMILDLAYWEEDAEFFASKTTDDGKDSNPHGS